MSYDNHNNIFEALQQFIDEHGDDFASLEEAIAEFVSYYRDEEGPTLDVSPQVESMELFQLALNINDDQQRKSILQQAIDLWPYNWDAQMELIEGSLPEQISQMRNLEQKAKDEWLKGDQSGWLSLEERPYLRIKYMFASLLFKNGLLYEAKEHFEEINEIDELDHLGTRYNLMAIYCRLYDWQSAYQLYSRVPYDAGQDDRMILPLLILAILLNKQFQAKDLLLDLQDANDGLDELFSHEHWPIDDILLEVEDDRYEPGTYSSIAIALVDIMPVIVGSEFVYQWLHNEYHSPGSNERVNVSDKVISFDAAAKHYQDSRPQISVDDSIEVLQGVVHNAAIALQQRNYVTIAAFADITEKELLQIKYIGPKTVEKLKENGVVFKEE